MIILAICMLGIYVTAVFYLLRSPEGTERAAVPLGHRLMCTAVLAWSKATRQADACTGSPEPDVPLGDGEREAWDEIVSCWRQTAPEPQPRGQS